MAKPDQHRLAHGRKFRHPGRRARSRRGPAPDFFDHLPCAEADGGLSAFRNSSLPLLRPFMASTTACSRKTPARCFPVSNYGAMKLASEGIITAALERFLKRAWICRFPNVVGGRATHGVIFDFLKKLRANPANWKCSAMARRKNPICTSANWWTRCSFCLKRSRDRLTVTISLLKKAHHCSLYRRSRRASCRRPAPASATPAAREAGWAMCQSSGIRSPNLKALGWSSKLTSNEAVELAIRENLS